MIKVIPIIFILLPIAFFAQSNNYQFKLEIPKILNSEIVIDGNIAENEWNNATNISKFIQREPDEGQPVSEKTEVYLIYDTENLYIAFRCWDNESTKIIANVMRRDEWLLNNDCVEIFIDTYHDHRNAFYFSTNALGAQRDGIITAELLDDQQNWDWNGVWDNVSRIDSLGWTAEIVIPFKTLRFNVSDSLRMGCKFFEKHSPKT